MGKDEEWEGRDVDEWMNHSYAFSNQFISSLQNKGK